MYTRMCVCVVLLRSVIHYMQLDDSSLVAYIVHVVEQSCIVKRVMYMHMYSGIFELSLP